MSSGPRLAEPASPVFDSVEDTCESCTQLRLPRRLMA